MGGEAAAVFVTRERMNFRKKEGLIMNENLERFKELLLTDEEFQSKLKAASEAYTGEQTEEAVFNNVLVPLAAEYGVTATFDEFKDYLSGLENVEMSQEELGQIAGGDKGFGASACFGVGVGVGGHGEGSRINAICILVGTGDKVAACAGNGVTTDD